MKVNELIKVLNCPYYIKITRLTDIYRLIKELNFDIPCIYIEQEVVKTQKSPYFGCELPVVPNNSLLIEAIAYYCIYKYIK